MQPQKSLLLGKELALTSGSPLQPIAVNCALFRSCVSPESAKNHESLSCVQALTAPMYSEDVASSQLGSNADMSTDNTANEDHPETPQLTQTPNSRESMPIAVPMPPALVRSGVKQQESFPDTQFDSTQESQLSAEIESTLENRMNLSAVDIERWIEGGSSSSISMPARVRKVPSNPVLLDAGPHSLQSSHVSARLREQPSRATWASAHSNSRFGPEKLLRSSIHVMHELESAMLTYDNLLIVQVAGVSGVCRALVKSLTKLTESCASIALAPAWHASRPKQCSRLKSRPGGGMACFADSGGCSCGPPLEGTGHAWPCPPKRVVSVACAHDAGCKQLLMGMWWCRRPDAKIGVLLLAAPRCSAGVLRMIHQSGFTVLPPLSNRRGSTCMWSTLFTSARVPRAMVVDSSTGSILCGDAIHSIHRKDVSKFPWQPPSWSSALVGAVLSACSSTTRAPLPSLLSAAEGLFCYFLAGILCTCNAQCCAWLSLLVLIPTLSCWPVCCSTHRGGCTSGRDPAPIHRQAA